ncbi:anti-sigma factor domain-containing protein [Bacillus sp. JZ8]
MKKGIVMDINREYIVVLTPDGEFAKAKREKATYELGEEVPVKLYSSRKWQNQKRQRSKWRRMAFTSLVIAAALLLFFIPFGQNKQEVFAYVSIDINPSIEIGVNPSYEVISLTGYNKEGKEIIAKLKRKWKYESFEKVANRILEKSEEEGYLHKNKEIIVTTSYRDEASKEREDFSKVVKDSTKTWRESEYKFVQKDCSFKKRNEAQKKGLSAGKYIEEKDPEKDPKDQKLEEDDQVSTEETEEDEKTEEENVEEENDVEEEPTSSEEDKDVEKDEQETKPEETEQDSNQETDEDEEEKETEEDNAQPTKPNENQSEANNEEEPEVPHSTQEDENQKPAVPSKQQGKDDQTVPPHAGSKGPPPHAENEHNNQTEETEEE